MVKDIFEINPLLSKTPMCKKMGAIGNNLTRPSDSLLIIVCLFDLGFNLIIGFIFPSFQFAATAVHCQNGPAVPGVLFEMEQPPEQFVDGVGPFVSNRGVLRRDPGLRQHLH